MMASYNVGLKSQHAPLSSLANQETFYSNVAYGGLESSLFAGVMFRAQWTGVEGAPTTYRAFAHVPIMRIKGGVGLQVQQFRHGAQSEIQGLVSYNLVQKTPLGLFSFGSMLGFQQYALDGSILRTSSGYYINNTINHLDQTLYENASTSYGALYGLSFFFRNRNIHVGAGVKQFPTYSIRVGSTKLRKTTVVRGMFEYNYKVSSMMSIQSAVHLMSDLQMIQSECYGGVRYREHIYVGVGLRGYNGTSLDAVLMQIGWRFDQHYTLYYNYDIGLSGIRDYSEGGHEILFTYNLARNMVKGLQERIRYNPRY